LGRYKQDKNYDYNRIKFTTTIDINLLQKIKTKAVNNNTNVNTILEQLIKQYL